MYSAPTSFSTIHCTTSTPRASTSPPGTCRMACRIPDRGAGFAGAAQAAPAREPLLRTFVGQRQADVRQLPVQPAPGHHEHHRAALVVVDGGGEARQRFVAVLRVLQRTWGRWVARLVARRRWRTAGAVPRSEGHTSELQSLMRIS